MSNIIYPLTQRLITDTNSEMQGLFAYLHGQPKTILMVAVETEIFRSNICWFPRKWQKDNNIVLEKLGVCLISKHGSVQYLTANPKLLPKNNPKLNLFSDDQ